MSNLKSRLDLLVSSIASILLIGVGLLFIVHYRVLWAMIHIVLCLVFIGLLLTKIYELFKHKKQDLKFWISVFADMLIIVYAFTNPIDFLTIVPIVIGWYALLNGIVQAINFYVYRRDMMRGTFYRFVLVLINFVTALVLILSPLRYIELLSKVAGSYLIFLGIVEFLNDTKDLIAPIAKRSKIKHMSISAPMILSAIIPARMLMSINQLMKSEADNPKENQNNADVEVFIYLSKNGPESFGHVDISVDGLVYSYGCHDPNARKLYGTLGDGILIEADRDLFIKEALEVENKTIVGYGITLDQNQKEIVKSRIEELLSRSIAWKCDYECGNTNAKDYASRVYKGTGAKMMKFTEKKFKTYFVFSTNCVLVVDHILRCAQLDLFNFDGIVTPGMYLSFLEREYKRMGSIVVSRNIYRR